MMSPLPLLFGYETHPGVGDAIIYLLDCVNIPLDRPVSTAKVMFFDFSSAFSSIRPPLLGEKLTVMQVDVHLVALIVDYPTDRPQYVHLHHCVSATVVSNTSNTWAPQGTALCGGELCHMV